MNRSVNSKQCGRLAAQRPAVRRYRSITARRTCRRAVLRAPALSSKRGQRHADSPRRRLNTDVFSISVGDLSQGRIQDMLVGIWLGVGDATRERRTLKQPAWGIFDSISPTTARHHCIIFFPAELPFQSNYPGRLSFPTVSIPVYFWEICKTTIVENSHSRSHRPL